ncbi:MAG: Panacea domain-containing protein [Actinomycetota bacterium]
MANVDDVAAAVLERTGEIDTWKLQKLVYYCQAWHLVWEDEPLFSERIEAWANGPVVRSLYREHRGRYRVKTWSRGNPGNLKRRELSSILSVVDFYASKSGFELSALTHREPPWKKARKGLEPKERSEREITKASMVEYYGSLA